jgi:hypothetical protein
MRRTTRHGGNAQDRRRQRRAAKRRTAGGEAALRPDDVAEIQALVAAASGSTSLPLSDRDVSWDADAADKRVRDWAGATDAPNAKYAGAFFVKQGDGTNFGDYKLGYADVIDGKLVAVWKAITAVAGVLQGARGGADITDAEASAARSKVESYYSKAAKQYDDDSIKVPWADGESAADAEALEVELSDEERDQIGELVAVVELGGKPSRGTKADKRLKDNKQPEDMALDALEAYEAAEPDARELATAFIKIRPDLAGFEAEVEAVVRAAIRRALVSAAGDVAWGLEEGFVDLLCDVNKQLAGGYAAYGFDYDEEPSCGYYCGPRAIDASVHLDKVLICSGDDYYVAPIEIDAAGEPVLSERSDWIEVGNGWLEKQADEMGAAALLRFALRDVQISLTADGASAPPIPAEHEPGERLPAATDAVEEPEIAAPAGGGLRWTATFVPEGVLTEDGRAFAPGALILPPEEGSRELPLTLMAMIETSAEGGHDGAKVAGRIDQLWREGDLVKASGVFSQEEYGQMIGRMVGTGELRGLSVDIAPLEWERSPASDWFDEDGNWIAERGEDGEWVTAGEEPTLEEAVERLFGGGEDMVLVITKGVIGMATVCPFPAFGDASISLVASGGASLFRYTGQAGFVVVREADCDCETESLAPSLGTVTTSTGGGGGSYGSGTFAVTASAVAGGGGAAGGSVPQIRISQPDGDDALTAAAAGFAPEQPPAEWFDDPELDELTPLTITDDGRVFGHAWAWETCHVSFDGCVTAPHSETGYAYFELGEVECADGERVPVGKITLDAPHAGQRLSRADAIRHYDHTGTVAAYVRFGEDDHGGWFAGAIRPDLPASKLRLLRGATVSGDWRGVDGNLELIALLAVNVPGFPVPRKRALVAAGVDADEPEVLSLTAAGVIAPLSDEQAAEIAALAALAAGVEE